MSDIQRVLVVGVDGQIAVTEIGSDRALKVIQYTTSGRISNFGLTGDAVAAPTRANPVAGVGFLYNGATLDRPRNNIEGELLASVARTVETSSATQTNYNHRGVYIFVDWTIEADTVTLTPKVEIQDPSSGDWIELFAAASALTAIGKATYLIYPEAVAAGGDITEIQDLALPRTWRFTMAVADSDSATYSVGYAMLP